jgi:hypothetical protein
LIATLRYLQSVSQKTATFRANASSLVCEDPLEAELCSHEVAKDAVSCVIAEQPMPTVDSPDMGVTPRRFGARAHEFVESLFYVSFAYLPILHLIPENLISSVVQGLLAFAQTSEGPLAL